MPLLVSYRGRPIRDRRRVGDRLRLTFFNRIPGERCRVVIVSQSQWQRHGTIQFFPKEQMPDVRALAAQAESAMRPHASKEQL